MSTPTFAYLAAPGKGLATLEHEGQRFVPLFARKEDLLAFGSRCLEQLEGYQLYVVSEPVDAARLLEALREAAVHVGIAEQATKRDATETTFAILSPDVLRPLFER